jgi:hypothetical protein
MFPQFRDSAAFVVNPPTDSREKTVVVLGAFRGGTSLIAQLLHELGVFMGERLAPPDREYDTVEDLQFQELLHRRDLLTRECLTPADFSSTDLAALQALIRQRNHRHALWGWKYPGTVVWCLHAGLAGYLRQPHFITVFRDPLAVFQHELDTGHVKPADVRRREGRSFHWVGLELQRLIEHAVRADAPHLLVSYERVRTGGPAVKEALVESVIRFLRPALAQPQRARALQILSGPRQRADNGAESTT